MIKKEKAGISVLQKLLVHGRMMANENKEYDFVKFFDDLEYLPSLILEPQDSSILFEDYLKSICSEFNCTHIYIIFILKLNSEISFS